MPQKYWVYTLEAAEKYRVSPYKIAGVMAIESRYDPRATSGHGRCIGLMQLDRGVARSLGVNPWNPRQNIMGGARILARLLRKHHGNLKLAVREYNGTGNRAYEREVLKAVHQAEKNANLKIRSLKDHDQ
jgi:soluble lytic murein transglycosylase-like protein